MEVVIDGKRYRAETELEKEATTLLCDVYGSLWTEAYYDHLCADTQRYAIPLAKKMARLNELLHFKK